MTTNNNTSEKISDLMQNASGVMKIFICAAVAVITGIYLLIKLLPVGVLIYWN